MAGKKNRSHFDKISANRKYKDTVFRKLFSDRKNLLSLYNAISGASYTDENAMEIVTLESAVYMGMKNDLAFILDTNLFLFEHQSTIILICRCVIYFTFPVNIRNWWTENQSIRLYC